MVSARFRFYAELNEFLSPEQRRREFCVPCAQAATTKHMIEALGVPHTEVELILVDGQAAGFDRRLRSGERVSVYPHFATFDVSSLLRLREPPPAGRRFIADAHLGGLARLLRMAGFDTLYRNDYADQEIVLLAARQGRIVLTRDRELLKRRAVTHGCYIHADQPAQQFGELLHRLDLARCLRPLTRCLLCNTRLRAIAKDRLGDRLPPSVRARQTRFALCRVCRRVFWPGSHWRRMRELLAAALSAAPGPTVAGRSAILRACSREPGEALHVDKIPDHSSHPV